ncbi:diguanylate cyclase [Xylanimonas oleitrophica]|uniref:histidine kinase n=1 Tax=Xylanimonas oleitrophica TaxID=2607479 RepID=A0A2W5WV77_9MICO|nr:PAS domain-containing protein [Xylanimonas oleitrophica]PZR52176.1 diguanylate cyclase [Xylanimonas oleitrophica]
MTATTLAAPKAATEQSAPVDVAGLVQALAVGTPVLVGSYRVELATGKWWWSDEVYLMHGRTPGEIEPNLDALCSRKHPDDRTRLVRTAASALRSGKPFATTHRIVDATGKARSVVVTGQARRERGRVTHVLGYIVDVTAVQREALERESQQAVDRAFVHAAAVEQVKGVFMIVKGIDDITASRELADIASRVGIPVHTAAAQIMGALAKAQGTGPTAEATLEAACAAVHPVERPRGHEAQLTRRRSRARG